MPLPTEQPSSASSSQGDVATFVELLSSFLLVGRPMLEAQDGALAQEPNEVTFERAGFWLAAPNVLDVHLVPLFGFTVHNGTSRVIAAMDVEVALFVDEEGSPVASAVVRFRFERTNGLQPGARFSGVANMRALANDAWAAPKVQRAWTREVQLSLRAAYDEQGNPIAGSGVASR